MNPVHQKDSIPRLLLLIILALGLLGTGVELLLLGHTEDVWQWVPLILLAAGLIIIGIWVRRRRRWSLRTFRQPCCCVWSPALSESTEFPAGSYAYFVTEGYPFVARCWQGTPDPSFQKPRRRR